MAHYAPKKSAEQAKLIDDLGGPSVVAGIVSDHLGLKGVNRLVPQTVSQWKRRGIPFAYRACLAIEARGKGIGVPAGFLGERARA